jgi:hypothetical protein
MYSGADDAAWIAGNDGIAGNVFGYDAATADDDFVTDRDTWHDDGIDADDAIVADVGVGA